MKLNQLVIEDYGPYAGKNSFNLRTTQEKPIVLFGGKNGAGKTTLFRAIQLCLHGKSAFGQRTSQKEYESHIKSHLHESGSHQASSGSVKLEFEYGNFGSTDNYIVERSWRDPGKTFVEELQIKRNGSKLSDLGEDHWEEFLKELIPPGVSQLFFFDGEQVQQLARAIEEGNEFEESLFSLLGLNLVDRLEADLSIYLSQKLDESGHDELAEKIDDLRDRKAELQAEYDELQQQIEEKQSEIEELNQQIDRKESELVQEGGAFAKKRDELKERRTQLETRIESLEEDIRDIAEGAYPFALSPDLCRQVENRLKSETEALTQEAAVNEVVDELDSLAGDETVWDEIEVPTESSQEIVNRIQSEIQHRFSPEAPDDYLLSNEFSERQRQEMYTLVDQALNTIPAELKELTDELEETTRELQDVEQQLSQAPEQTVISPLVEKIDEKTDRRAELKTEVQTHKVELEELETKLGRTESQLENRLDDYEEIDDVSRRTELASDVRSVVKDYRSELAKEKLQRLETTLTERYLALSNKSEFYDRVLIDPDQVSIEIETVNGDRKDQSQLSAGERQIFATAMLWALADISGRPLPFMIDTPLGRLDQEHRGNVVRNFFPSAAHQVILFSTDTEITEEYYDALEDHISLEYHLEYNGDRGRTDVSRGYFWSSGVQAGPERESPVHETQQQVHLGEVNNE